MPSVEQLRGRLFKKLKELFQLNQPDLDFGFYRIMHAKAKQVQEFLEKDLLKIVSDAFSEVDEAKCASYKADYEKTLKMASDLGAPDPENTPAVKDAKQKWNAVKDSSRGEAEVYDHLYHFFERYYDDGDFISRRYFTRETSGRAAPFAIPYNGEEVKLHWANSDQYYIKTAEHFSNYTFDLVQSAEVKSMSKSEKILQQIPERPMKVHFRIVTASEGEHGNVKVADQSKRFFIIHENKPVELDANQELVICFEYRSDLEKGSAQEGAWREKRNSEAVVTVLQRLESLQKSDKANREIFCDYLLMLKIAAPTDKDSNRPLLAKYITQYTGRNTMDYFIHKDLGGFLRRELDFYIKNEVMRLDDIENAEAPAVETYLKKVRVMRKIAGKLIDFLAQLEDFQKKLWLKKKFVVETNYCVTLDRVPEELYPDIIKNEEQHNQWVELFAIDEIKATKGDLLTPGLPGYSKPLKIELLKANNKLVLDTRLFDENFKARLLASIESFDEQCDGLLLHSENFQALNFLSNRFQRQVKSVYLDPPYNTGDDGFAYKDSYKHATWLSMMSQTLCFTRKILRTDSLIFSSIDRDENRNLLPLFFSIFGEQNFVEEIIWQKAYGGGSKTRHINNLHEYIICFSEDKNSLPKLWLPPNAEILKYYKFQDSKLPIRGKFRTQPLYTNSNDFRPNLTYPLPIPKACEPETDQWDKAFSIIRELLKSEKLLLLNTENGWKYDRIIDGKSEAWNGELVFPAKQWQWSWDRTRDAIINDELVFKKTKSEWSVDYKQYQLDEDGQERGTKPASIQIGPYTQTGTSELNDLFTKEIIKFPKPTGLLRNLIAIDYTDQNGVFGDWFAGSGTTGHAVINLNREDGGNRKYVLIEMGDYFHTVLKPRISKVIYSEDWKDGKPTARDSGVSHCFKYMRLESYEDTLNNLRFDEQVKREEQLQTKSELKEDFILHYLLDVETRGSQSLLNINDFADPTAYKLKVKKPGTDETVTQSVDLIETFNYLIGLRVNHIAAPQNISAAFKRIKDPELPKDRNTRLVIDGKIQNLIRGPWWFRKVEGWVPADPMNPNNGQREKVLIVWRKLTGDLEQDNLVLDEWFKKNRISSRDFEFDLIYVNGSNNLPNLKLEGDNWKVRLIEEEFMTRMWEAE